MPQCHIHHMAVTLPVFTEHVQVPALLNELFGLVGIDPDTIKQSKGRAGYSSLYALKTATGAELISVATSQTGNNKNTTHIVIHGAAFESGGLDAMHIGRVVEAKNGWCCEIHLAADDDPITPELDFADLIDAASPENWEGRISTRCCRKVFDKKTGEWIDNPPVYFRQRGQSVIFPGKAIEIIVYDERGFTRAESKIRTVAAASDLLHRIASGESVHTLTLGVLGSNLTIHQPGMKRKDRRPATAYWLAFLSGAEPIKLSHNRETTNKSPWYVPISKAQALEKKGNDYIAEASDREELDSLLKTFERLRIGAEERRLDMLLPAAIRGTPWDDIPAMPAPYQNFDSDMFAPDITF